MRLKTFRLFFCLFSLCYVFGQNKKDLKLSFSAGFFNSKVYTNAKSRFFFNFGFDHSVTKRHIIAADYIAGQFRYYDDVRVTTPVPLSTPGYEKHTNADARTTVFSVMYKYKLLYKNKISLSAGTGIGIITESYYHPVDLANGGFTFQNSGRKGDLCFPLRVDVDYQIFKKIQLGILAGTYVYPDYPLAGQHAGFKVSYLIQ